MESKSKHLLLALLIGIIVLFGNKVYIDSVVSKYKDRNVVKIMRAAKQIRAGTPLGSKLVEEASVPEDFVPKARILWNDRGLYLGQELGVDVLKGDYVLESYFATRALAGKTLSQQLEAKNFRAINLPVDEVNSLSRSIAAGDRIDIIFSFNIPVINQKMSTVLFQNVPVIATGQYSPADEELGAKGKRAERYNSLTLQMSAQDAVRLDYARQMGKISILLRNAKDDTTLDMPPIHSVLDLLSAADRETVAQMAEQAKREMMDQDKIRQQLQQVLEQNRKQGKTE